MLQPEVEPLVPRGHRASAPVVLRAAHARGHIQEGVLHRKGHPAVVIAVRRPRVAGALADGLGGEVGLQTPRRAAVRQIRRRALRRGSRPTAPEELHLRLQLRGLEAGLGELLGHRVAIPLRGAPLRCALPAVGTAAPPPPGSAGLLQAEPRRGEAERLCDVGVGFPSARAPPLQLPPPVRERASLAPLAGAPAEKLAELRLVERGARAVAVDTARSDARVVGAYWGLDSLGRVGLRVPGRELRDVKAHPIARRTRPYHPMAPASAVFFMRASAATPPRTRGALSPVGCGGGGL
mmetsp:Transcript_3158/g.8612  ORF Transcript_3158/g.8612 Transcript_3158/m.8612 type:complete len:294 (+) Transcript_3158:162-1043(+)